MTVTEARASLAKSLASTTPGCMTLASPFALRLVLEDLELKVELPEPIPAIEPE